MKQVITTEEAPKAIGPYSQAVKVGKLLFTAGQIAIDPASGELKSETIEDEVNQVMSNLKAVLKAGGASFDDVVKTTIFMTDLSLFGKVNMIYGSYFQADPPARSTVEVANLPKDVTIEIEMIAFVPTD